MLYYRDIMISFLNKTLNLWHPFPDVLKCAGPDCRLIAQKVSVQELKKIFNFITVSTAELHINQNLI